MSFKSPQTSATFGSGTLSFSSLTAGRTFTFPDAAGTLLSYANQTDGLNTLGIKAVYKSSDTSRTTTTTLAADPDLTFTLPVGTWWIEVAAFYSNSNNTPGGVSQVQFTGTASFFAGTVYIGNSDFVDAGVTSFAPSATYANLFAPVVTRPIGGVSSQSPVVWRGLCKVTVQGTFALWWSQNASSATATVLKAGSYILRIKVAE